MALLENDGQTSALSNQELRSRLDKGMETYNQMREVVGRQELDRLKNSERAQDAIASALAIASAPENKGRLPRPVTDYLNRQFGFDGKTSGIIDGGIDPKTGEFGFVFGERDSEGKTAYRRQMLPLSAQLGLMEGYPGLFNEDAVKAHRAKMMDPKFGGFSSGEVDAYSNVAKMARERRARRMEELTPRDTKLEIERMKQAGADRRLFAKTAAGGGGSMKETIGALAQMQNYLDNNGSGMSEEAQQQMRQAIAAGYAGLAAKFLPQQPAAPREQGGQDGTDTALPEGMKEGDETEHNGKTYVLGYKDGRPTWLLKKNGGDK